VLSGPTKLEPLLIDCPNCEGLGCDLCDDGDFELTSCPKLAIDRELQECLPYAELYKQGIPPVAGGSTDQTQWFTVFCLALWEDEDRIRAQQKQ